MLVRQNTSENARNATRNVLIKPYIKLASRFVEPQAHNDTTRILREHIIHRLELVTHTRVSANCVWRWEARTLNVISRKTLGGTTTRKVLFGMKPNSVQLHTFGYKIYVQIPDKNGQKLASGCLNAHTLHCAWPQGHSQIENRLV